MPGHAKMFSMMTEPPISPGRMSPNIVTKGSAAFRRACMVVHGVLVDPLGARRADEVRIHHLHHLAAHVAREHGDAADRPHEAGQHEMPDAVVDSEKGGGAAPAEGFDSQDGDLEPGDAVVGEGERKALHHRDDEDVGEKEAGRGYHQVAHEGGGAVEEGVAAQRARDSEREGEAPGDEGAHDEQGQADEEAPPYLSEDGLVVLEARELAGEEFFVEAPVLDGKRLVEVEGGAVAGEVLLREARVEGVDLARLAGGRDG